LGNSCARFERNRTEIAALLAPSVILGRLASSGQVRALAGLIAGAALVVSGPNLLEDDIDVGIAGPLYVLGFITGWLGLLALALAFWRDRTPRLALIAISLFAGVGLFMVAAGGVLVRTEASWCLDATAVGWLCQNAQALHH
jgi:hypothetical protein